MFLPIMELAWRGAKGDWSGGSANTTGGGTAKSGVLDLHQGLALGPRRGEAVLRCWPSQSPSYPPNCIAVKIDSRKRATEHPLYDVHASY